MLLFVAILMFVVVVVRLSRCGCYRATTCCLFVVVVTGNNNNTTTTTHNNSNNYRDWNILYLCIIVVEWYLVVSPMGRQLYHCGGDQLSTQIRPTRRDSG